MNNVDLEGSTKMQSEKMSPDALTIITCISVDTESSDFDAHYPQMPYVNSSDRRLVFWKCAMVFFASSCAVNGSARHFLYTNDPQVPSVDGVDCTKFLTKLGVGVIYLPFGIHKPPAGVGRIFRNNFYKLDVIYDAARRHNGRILLTDSDVVWINQLPPGDVLDGLSLYPVFQSRDRGDRAPTGISADDLETMFQSLDASVALRETCWVGGEFIGGTAIELVKFSRSIRETFEHWCEIFDPSIHVFSNGSTIFDNDEFLLSYAASRYPDSIRDGAEVLRRIWTDEAGGGTSADYSLSAWHLPNEKLRGFKILFDDICIHGRAVGRLEIGAACGVPSRIRHYVPKSLWLRAGRVTVVAIKSVLPRRYYNVVRGIFGRAPI